MVFSGHQPNLLPYLGVFYKMYKSDVFVLDDDVQYSTDGLHNSNYLKINGERNKFTVPVSFNHGSLINEVKISYTKNWDKKLLRTLELNYKKAPFFEDCYEMAQRHISKKHEMLVDLNIGFIKEIAERLKLNCKIVIASETVPTTLKKNDRNIYQCKSLGGTIYYSGQGGKEYNDEELYKKNRIKIAYSSYTPFPYSQLGNRFVENLSVLDYLMNQGFNIPVEWK